MHVERKLLNIMAAKNVLDGSGREEWCAHFMPNTVCRKPYGFLDIKRDAM
jgi:hypothetical protein